jgi:multidrug efflux pump subunit AcrA (membrane-fusion protein)
MRSLQRLRHVRPAVQESAFQQARIHKLDTKAVKRREREIWLRRIRRAVFLVVVALVTIAVISTIAGSRIVASGIVRSNVVVLEAPSDARVARLHVHAGGSVNMGDPLIELQPTAPDRLRAELRARWDATEAQLAWFDAGGELELSGQPQRRDLVAAARRSEALERADGESLAALIPVRIQEQRLAEAAVEAARRDLVAAERSGLAREERQSKELELAQLESEQATLDEARAEDLAAQGIQSKRTTEVATLAARVQAGRVASLKAGLEVLESERVGAVAAAEAALLAAERQMGVATARVDQAEAASRAAAARAAAWSVDAKRHEALAPQAPVRPEVIRKARRAKLSADVQVAKAAYESHVRIFGDRVILANTRGSIDEILALEGSVVKAGDPLVRYHDPASMELVVYATPSATAELMVGDTCTVHCSADGRKGQATILAIGHVWIEAPSGLGRSTGESRVAVTLTLNDEISPFSANARVKAAFETDRWTAFKQRVLNWAQR